MKRIFSLVIATLFLLHGFASFADVLFVPESNFYQQHREECTRVDRDYYSNGAKGYIALYKKPDGTLVEYLRNAHKVRIFCTYKDWGMISYLNGSSLKVAKWVQMSDLYLIYDEQSFREDYADKITQSTEPLTLPENTEKVLIYQYPGAETYFEFKRNIDGLRATTRYTDSEGRIWGRIDYYQGIRKQWICFSEPFEKIEPFGGDPNLKTFEKYTFDGQLPEVAPEDAADLDYSIQGIEIPNNETITGPDTNNEDTLVDNPDEEIVSDSIASSPAPAPNTPASGVDTPDSDTPDIQKEEVSDKETENDVASDSISSSPSGNPDTPKTDTDSSENKPVETPSYNSDAEKDDTDVKVPENNVVPDNTVSAPSTDTESPDAEKEDVPLDVPDQSESLSESVTIAPPTEEGTSDVFAPEEPPHRIPVDPLVIVSIVLVGIAVIAAIVLIIVCYKRKEK